MKTKILILIYLLIIGGVGYFVYPIFQDRYFSSQETESEKSSLTEDRIDINGSDDTDTDDDYADTPVEEVPEDVFIDVDAEDCEDNCEQFEDEEDKKYCQEYCGLLEKSTPSDNDCEKLEDLEKDYCYKNQALSKKDFNLCKKIIDKKLLESCKTRLTEDLINGSNPIDE